MANKALKSVGEAVRKAAYSTAGALERGLDNLTSSDVAEKIKERSREAGNAIRDGYNASVQYFKREYCDSEGKFDPEKFNEALKNSPGKLKGLGSKALEAITSGAENLKQDYRDLIPNKEERDTKYSGIGGSYKGILFREHYEACLSFSAQAEKKLPAGIYGRRQILQDIKDYAAGSSKDLIDLYSNGNDSASKRKLSTVVNNLH